MSVVDRIDAALREWEREEEKKELLSLDKDLLRRVDKAISEEETRPPTFGEKAEDFTRLFFGEAADVARRTARAGFGLAALAHKKAPELIEKAMPQRTPEGKKALAEFLFQEPSSDFGFEPKGIGGKIGHGAIGLTRDLPKMTADFLLASRVAKPVASLLGRTRVAQGAEKALQAVAARQGLGKAAGVPTFGKIAQRGLETIGGRSGEIVKGAVRSGATGMGWIGAEVAVEEMTKGTPPAQAVTKALKWSSLGLLFPPAEFVLGGLAGHVAVQSALRKGVKSTARRQAYLEFIRSKPDLKSRGETIAWLRGRGLSGREAKRAYNEMRLNLNEVWSKAQVDEGYRRYRIAQQVREGRVGRQGPLRTAQEVTAEGGAARGAVGQPGVPPEFEAVWNLEKAARRREASRATVAAAERRAAETRGLSNLEGRLQRPERGRAPKLAPETPASGPVFDRGRIVGQFGEPLAVRGRTAPRVSAEPAPPGRPLRSAEDLGVERAFRKSPSTPISFREGSVVNPFLRKAERAEKIIGPPTSYVPAERRHFISSKKRPKGEDPKWTNFNEIKRISNRLGASVEVLPIGGGEYKPVLRPPMIGDPVFRRGKIRGRILVHSQFKEEPTLMIHELGHHIHHGLANDASKAGARIRGMLGEAREDIQALGYAIRGRQGMLARTGTGTLEKSREVPHPRGGFFVDSLKEGVADSVMMFHHNPSRLRQYSQTAYDFTKALMEYLPADVQRSMSNFGRVWQARAGLRSKPTAGLGSASLGGDVVTKPVLPGSQVVRGRAGLGAPVGLSDDVIRAGRINPRTLKGVSPLVRQRMAKEGLLNNDGLTLSKMKQRMEGLGYDVGASNAEFGERLIADRSASKAGHRFAGREVPKRDKILREIDDVLGESRVVPAGRYTPARGAAQSTRKAEILGPDGVKARAAALEAGADTTLADDVVKAVKKHPNDPKAAMEATVESHMAVPPAGTKLYTADPSGKVAVVEGAKDMSSATAKLASFPFVSRNFPRVRPLYNYAAERINQYKMDVEAFAQRWTLRFRKMNKADRKKLGEAFVDAERLERAHTQAELTSMGITGDLEAAYKEKIKLMTEALDRSIKRGTLTKGMNPDFYYPHVWLGRIKVVNKSGNLQNRFVTEKDAIKWIEGELKKDPKQVFLIDPHVDVSDDIIRMMKGRNFNKLFKEIKDHFKALDVDVSKFEKIRKSGRIWSHARPRLANLDTFIKDDPLKAIDSYYYGMLRRDMVADLYKAADETLANIPAHRMPNLHKYITNWRNWVAGERTALDDMIVSVVDYLGLPQALNTTAPVLVKKLSRLGAQWGTSKLWMNPLSTFVNATQTFTTTSTVIGSKWTRRGMKETMDTLYKQGNWQRNRQVVDELGLIVQKEPGRAGELIDFASNAENFGPFSRFVRYMLLPFNTVERGNRFVAGLGSYWKAIGEGKRHEAAVRIARETIDLTQFNYEQWAAPPLLRSDSAAVLLQFKKYPHFAVEFFLSMPNNLKAKYARNMMLVAGTSAVPFSGGLGWALGKITGVDPVAELESAAPRLVAGLGGLFGVDVRRSVGAEDWFPKEFKEVFGPVPNQIVDLVAAGLHREAKHKMRAWKSASPPVVSRTMRFLQEAKDNYAKTAAGDKLMELSPGMILLRLGGFQPTSVSQVYARKQADIAREEDLQRRRGRAKDRIASGKKVDPRELRDLGMSPQMMRREYEARSVPMLERRLRRMPRPLRRRAYERMKRQGLIE